MPLLFCAVIFPFAPTALFASPPCFSATWMWGGAPSCFWIVFLCSSIVCLSSSISSSMYCLSSLMVWLCWSMSSLNILIVWLCHDSSSWMPEIRASVNSSCTGMSIGTSIMTSGTSRINQSSSLPLPLLPLPCSLWRCGCTWGPFVVALIRCWLVRFSSGSGSSLLGTSIHTPISARGKGPERWLTSKMSPRPGEALQQQAW